MVTWMSGRVVAFHGWWQHEPRGGMSLAGCNAVATALVHLDPLVVRTGRGTHTLHRDLNTVRDRAIDAGDGKRVKSDAATAGSCLDGWKGQCMG